MSHKETAETASGTRTIRRNQAVLILTGIPGKTWRGIIRSAGKTKSLVRFNEDGVLRERRLENSSLLVVKCKPKGQSTAPVPAAH